MKILFCANIYESGFVGPARLAEGLLQINARYRGRHELRILTADVREERFPVYKMTVQYPRFLRFFDFLLRGWVYYQGILRVQKEFDFDVVLFGNALYCLPAKFFLKTKFIAGFINDDHLIAVRWNNFLKHEGGKSLVFLNRIEKFCTQRLDLVIVCSQYLRQFVLDRYRCSSGKLFVLYQGIELEKIPFQPREINPQNVIHILFVKNRFRLGGLHTLAEALSKLDGFKFKMTVLGPPLENKSEITRWFEKMPHVSLDFRGAVSQEIVHRELALHHILCIPAELEGQGLANVEGLAHGISVVSANAGGIPEVLDKGKNGWLCEPANADSLAEVLKNCILASPEERLAKSRKSRQFAEENFSVPVMLDNLLDRLTNTAEKECR